MNQIPRLYSSGRLFKWEEVYKAVSVQLVKKVMDVLRAHLARSWPAGGLPIHGDADHRLVAATCSALGSLVEAHAAPHHRHAVRELALQIQDFLQTPPKAGEIQSLRDDRDINPAVYYSLLALIAQWVIQRRERAPDTGGPDAVDRGESVHSRQPHSHIQRPGARRPSMGACVSASLGGGHASRPTCRSSRCTGRGSPACLR